MASSAETVLVTGGSGFIAIHLILQLLEKGYKIHTTIRSPKREAEIRDALREAGAQDIDARLTFFTADLTSDQGWKEAVTGCTYVQHVASPFPMEVPKDENELIIPAREGALRVLRAARDAKVKRIVLTSSVAAVSAGHPPRTDKFTEEDWSILDGSKGVQTPPYPKSKTIAEKAAWDFVKAEGGDMELVVVNPVAVLGPVLTSDVGTSNQLIKKLLDGSVPGVPNISMGIVDVRDIADLHILAMLDPAAKGERYIGIADNGVRSFISLAKLVKAERPNEAKKAPTMQLPNLLVKAVALFDPAVRLIIPDLGKKSECSNEKAKSKLGWKPRSVEESVLDTVDSLVSRKLV